MAKRARKIAQRTASIVDAVSGACADLMELGQECREVVDNMPESLQQGSRGEALSASADAIEDISEPDIPDVISDLTVTWPENVKRKPSRADRRDASVAALDAAIQAAEKWRDDMDEAKEAVLERKATAEQQKLIGAILAEEEFEDELVAARSAMNEGTATVEQQKLIADALADVELMDVDTFIDEATEIKDNADGCDFPGMYG